MPLFFNGIVDQLKKQHNACEDFQILARSGNETQPAAALNDGDAARIRKDRNDVLVFKLIDYNDLLVFFLEWLKPWPFLI